MLHFQCFIVNALANHTCLYRLAHGCSDCLPHGVPGIHCSHLGRWLTCKVFWRPKVEKHLFLPISNWQVFLRQLKRAAWSFLIILFCASSCHSYYSDIAHHHFKAPDSCISCTQCVAAYPPVKMAAGLLPWVLLPIHARINNAWRKHTSWSVRVVSAGLFSRQGAPQKTSSFDA